MPSILMKPDCGSNARCSNAMAVDLPAPVGPTKAMVWPGSAVKERSSTAGRLPSYENETSLNSTRPEKSPGVDRVGPVADRGHGIQHVEEFLQPRRLHEHVVDEADHLFELLDQHGCETHEHHDLAD